jgi:hypothetical protein
MPRKPKRIKFDNTMIDTDESATREPMTKRIDWRSLGLCIRKKDKLQEVVASI